QRGRPVGTDDRKQPLGQRRAGLDGDHAKDGEEDGEEAVQIFPHACGGKRRDAEGAARSESPMGVVKAKTLKTPIGDSASRSRRFPPRAGEYCQTSSCSSTSSCSGSSSRTPVSAAGRSVGPSGTMPFLASSLAFFSAAFLTTESSSSWPTRPRLTGSTGLMLAEFQ